MTDLIVNLYRYVMGIRVYDNWKDKEMYYVLTKSGNLADWLQIRRQIKFRDELRQKKIEK